MLNRDDVQQTLLRAWLALVAEACDIDEGNLGPAEELCLSSRCAVERPVSVKAL